MAAIELDQEQSQVFRRLQTLVRESSAELETAQATVAVKSREAKKAKIVHAQLAAVQKVEPQVRVFESFGKAFVLSDVKRISRNLQTTEKEALDDIKTLTSKLQTLERQTQSHQSNLQTFLKRVGAR